MHEQHRGTGPGSPIHTVIYIALTVSTWTTVLLKIRDLPAAYYSTTRLAAHFQRCWFYFLFSKTNGARLRAGGTGRSRGRRRRRGRGEAEGESKDDARRHQAASREIDARPRGLHFSSSGLPLAARAGARIFQTPPTLLIFISNTCCVFCECTVCFLGRCDAGNIIYCVVMVLYAG